MPLPFDPTWPHGHKTRDGHKAKIIYTNLKGRHGETIVAILTDHNGYEIPKEYLSNGKYFANMNSPIDLRNAK